MVNIVFHLKSDEGHIERFSFDVYMSPLPIFTKIKHPFAWHISFLVRHLRKYSEKTFIFFKKRYYMVICMNFNFQAFVVRNAGHSAGFDEFGGLRIW